MPIKYVRASVITAAALAGAATDAWAARVDYTVDVGVEDNDNVTYAAIDPIAQRYLRAGLGFAITENVSALQMSLTGRAEYRDYRDDVFGNTVNGELAGRLNWVALPDRLFFTVEDSLAVQPVNVLAADAPGNRQQVNVFALGPTLLFNMPASMQGRAELRYVNSDAEVTDEFNSQHVALALRAIRELSPTSRLSMNGQVQRVDFDNDIVARDYNRYDLFARYSRSLAHFELGADFGYSHIDYRRGESRSDPLLRLDAEWNPTPSSQFTAAVASQFSDTATDALRGVEAGAPSGEPADTPVEVPDQVLTGDAVVNASPYEVRSADLGYAYTGPRLHFAISPYLLKRNYVDSDEFDQKGHGGRFDLEWTIRPQLTLGTYATHESLEYTVLEREDKTLRLGALLRYRWTRHLGVNLQWERYKRESTEPGQDVEQNIVYLSLSYSNR